MASTDRAPCQSSASTQPRQIGAQARSVDAGLGRRAPVRPFLHTLVGVEGDEGSVVEDALGHDEGTRERLLHQDAPIGEPRRRR